MALFLMAVLTIGLSACHRQGELAAGAPRVKRFHATFHWNP